MHENLRLSKRKNSSQNLKLKENKAFTFTCPDGLIPKDLLEPLIIVSNEATDYGTDVYW